MGLCRRLKIAKNTKLKLMLVRHLTETTQEFREGTGVPLTQPKSSGREEECHCHSSRVQGGNWGATVPSWCLLRSRDECQVSYQRQEALYIPSEMRQVEEVYSSVTKTPRTGLKKGSNSHAAASAPVTCHDLTNFPRMKKPGHRGSGRREWASLLLNWSRREAEFCYEWWGLSSAPDRRWWERRRTRSWVPGKDRGICQVMFLSRSDVKNKQEN